MAWAAVAMAGGALVGGALASQGAKSAANTQANAANNATQAQMNMFNQTQQNLQPYMGAGQNALNTLQGQLPDLTQPFQPTMQQLQSMPGYQFQLQQGLEATQNGYAAKGLGSSGAAMKGAARYAQGLASSDLGQLANLYYTNQNNAYNKLMGVANLGQNSAANVGQIGANYAGGIANTMTGAGNALAAGQVGQANAWSNAANNIGNNYLMYNMYQRGVNGSTQG